MKLRVVLSILLLSFMVSLNSPVNIFADEKVEANSSEDSELFDEFGDEQESEELFDDFGDDNSSSSPETNEPEKAEESSIFSLDGFLKLGSTYNFAHKKPAANQIDWRGISRLKTEIQLGLTAKFTDKWRAYISGNYFYDFAYELNDRDEYNSEILDNYEDTAEIREAWISGGIGPIDIKIGRQIVVWGKSDNIRVTDILNPLNVREPGMTDIEDLRIPLCMTRMDFYAGNFSITGVAVHENKYNKIPVYGSDFYPESFALPDEEIPEMTLEDSELALAVNGNFSGWDIAFYFASVYNDDYNIKLQKNPSFPSTSTVPALPDKIEHTRINMAGSAFNIVTGSWVLKAEAAFFNGIKISDKINVSPTYDVTFSESEEYTKTDALLGAEYSGFTNTTISIEGFYTIYNNYDDYAKTAEVEEKEFQTAIRISRTFINDTLTLTFVALYNGENWDKGSLQRYTAEYDLMDALTLTGGAVFYNSGDSMLFENIEDNDRIFFDIKYSF